MLISSLQNPKIKHIVRLKSRRQRDLNQLILVEGYRAVSLALKNGFALNEIYFCPDLYSGSKEQELVENLLGQNAGGYKTYQTTAEVFSKMAYRDQPEGLIAIGPQFDTSIRNLPVNPDSLFLVAESVEKPGNLGTMLRSADAAGAEAVIICDGVTDVFNPNVVRASVGALFTIKVGQATSQELFEWSAQNKIQLVAATPSAKQPYTRADLTGKIAIAVGAEQSGLSKTWLDQAGQKVRIPMHGQVDSLNVSAAATVILFEALRQRS
ncbi:RNA methyltransferase [Candidatus Saccharibacteria bacterium]|nr:RNA methyltransferase [Candidatus Saccharibacteria bacterium]